MYVFILFCNIKIYSLVYFLNFEEAILIFQKSGVVEGKDRDKVKSGGGKRDEEREIAGM